MHRLEKNILHHAKKQREQRKYKIFEGVDHFNNKPLYRINGINNDYIGEWHATKESLCDELNASLNQRKYLLMSGQRIDTEPDNFKHKIILYEDDCKTIKGIGYY